jgi:hypothetical protein
VKTNGFTYINALCSQISRPDQKLGFLTPQSNCSGAELDAKQSDLFEQPSPDREACTERRRFSFSN